MKPGTLAGFLEIRDSLRNQVDTCTGIDSRLVPVYNKDLDRFDPGCDIRYILVADNPGKKELAESRYMIGTAGRQARNFFHDQGLADDFESQVMVLNKTFLHTPATGDLKALLREGALREHLIRSQRIMADHITRFHRLLKCDLWIVGCGEMRQGGIFATFLDAMDDFYRRSENRALRARVFCYKHFSYGNFSRDLDLKNNPPDLVERLERVGTDMRQQVFGW